MKFNRQIIRTKSCVLIIMGGIEMKRQEITVKAKQGIHATPAIVLVNQARSYKSDIKLYKGSNGIDMKNVLRVLGLAVRCDDTVVVEAEGEDEELAVEQLIEAISNMK